MDNLKISVEEIKFLMDKLSQTGLGELHIKDGDFDLKIAALEKQIIETAFVPGQQVSAQNSCIEQPSVSAPEAKPTPCGNVVKSPLVGTFYAKPSPDKEDFCCVGKKVRKGETLFIIESMKLMNEIQSDFDGEVAEILCENGQAVEFGQPIIVIK
jgi:acetyl-CoA carboxylase biotin carboxyl carrier protein